MNAIKEKTSLKGKDLFHPIRLALTGEPSGPELKILLPLIGYQKAYARLKGQKAWKHKTCGFNRICNEPYPSLRILKMVAKHNIPVIISDDAHNFECLADRFDKAPQLALEAGIKHFLWSDEKQTGIYS